MAGQPENPDNPDRPNGQPPDVPRAVVRRGASISSWLIWLVPIVAITFGAFLGLRALSERGPMIQITFKSAEGIEPRKTKIRYRSVDVGEVRSLTLTRDRSAVVVTAQMTREAAGLLNDDSKFWVVRPRISGSSVTGLGTLLAGAYIGMDAGKSENTTREFVGLEQPAIVTSDVPGRMFIVRGEDMGSLDVGSPIYYRHIPVGQVAGYELAPDGKSVVLHVFVNAPYDRSVTRNTRFFHAEGIDFQLDASGLKVDTQSLVSILLGGLAFESLPNTPDAPAAEANTEFPLFANRVAAMKPPERGELYTLLFTESVRNLNVGAPVDFRGVPIGEVKSIDIEYDPDKKRVAVPVVVRIDMERLRARRKDSKHAPPRLDPKAFVDRMVELGFRAQVRTASLVSGQLFVALDFFPEAPKEKVDWTRTPPELPTLRGSLEELQVTIGNIAKKLEKVPFEKIGNDLDTTLRSANKLIDQLERETVPELKGTLEEARRTLRSVQESARSIEQMAAPDAPLQQNLGGTLDEVAKAASSLRALADYLERHPESLIRGKKKDAP
jgi:paraquat-inducible protein B